MTRSATGQKLTFKCSTSDHSPVILVGDSPEMGAWNLDRGIPLQPSDGGQSHVEWSATVELQIGHTIEYKFVKKTDRGPIWENGYNRRYTVIQGQHTLSDVFRQ